MPENKKGYKVNIVVETTINNKPTKTELFIVGTSRADVKAQASGFINNCIR